MNAEEKGAGRSCPMKDIRQRHEITFNLDKFDCLKLKYALKWFCLYFVLRVHKEGKLGLLSVEQQHETYLCSVYRSCCSRTRAGPGRLPCPTGCSRSPGGPAANAKSLRCQEPREPPPRGKCPTSAMDQ